MPAANYHGGDSLTMTSNDLGQSGSGGALQDTDVVPIIVASVNDAPLVVGDGAESAATIQEDMPAPPGKASPACSAANMPIRPTATPSRESR